MKKEQWLIDFDKVSEINNDFGGNCFNDLPSARKYMKSLVKLGADIKILDYENIIITLPQEQDKRENILLYIITTCPTPTDAHYKKNQLELTWS